MLEEPLGMVQGRAGNRVVKALCPKVGNRENPESDIEVGHHSPVLPAPGIGEGEMPIPPLGQKLGVGPLIFREVDLGRAEWQRFLSHRIF